mmetsp:Transcript_73640/g.117152  ORF Transcript_73640/g.117152 Transcript_73640/m.117152 type:complete len:203 (-) Transcript_73640:588-1196(-)
MDLLDLCGQDIAQVVANRGHHFAGHEYHLLMAEPSGFRGPQGGGRRSSGFLLRGQPDLLGCNFCCQDGCSYLFNGGHAQSLHGRAGRVARSFHHFHRTQTCGQRSSRGCLTSALRLLLWRETFCTCCSSGSDTNTHGLQVRRTVRRRRRMACELHLVTSCGAQRSGFCRGSLCCRNGGRCSCRCGRCHCGSGARWRGNFGGV